MELVIYNRVIDTDVEDILNKLKVDCEGRFLKDIYKKGDSISITCPEHKGGQESHPSCSVYNRIDNPDVMFGTFHCFTCGTKGPLWTLVSRCLGITQEEGKRWLIDNFSSLYEDKQIILEPFEKVETKKEYLDESILEQYSYFHPYQFKRGLSEHVIRLFKIGYDTNSDMITFPVWDENDNLLGITKRSVTSKRFEIPENLDKPVYLLNYIKKYNFTDVIVCESQINTLTCWNWGFPAVGLIGTGSNKQYEILNKSGIRRFHLALDGDVAGRHGNIRFIEKMRDDVLIDVIDIPQGKDVNDLSKEEFLSLPKIDKFSYK